MEKSRRQRSSSSSSPPSEITHHFFKVYLPSFCLYSLKIPITFMKKLNGVISEKVILKDPLKRLWHVEMTKVKEVFYFQNGWEEFVKCNCLKIGDFMVFCYVGNSVFYVDIFDNSECEKKFESKDNIDFTKKLNKTTTPFVNEEEVESESDDQTSSDFVCWPPEGEDCEEEIYKSEQSAESNGEMEEISNPVGFIQSKLPHFVALLKMTTRYSLHIPKELVDRDDIDIMPKMVLRDPNRRSWPVKICFLNDRSVIGKGWFDFWKGNNLVPGAGDQCIFEFNKCKAKGRPENSNVINVKVVRATGKRSSAPHKT